MADKEKSKRRQLVGTVLSNKTDQTVTIGVDRYVIHPVYKKYLRRRTKYAAHDAQNACQTGDQVLITESRPLSRRKRWRVSRIIEKAV